MWRGPHASDAAPEHPLGGSPDQARTGTMRCMADDKAAPHPIRASDVKALHGMIAVLAAEAIVDGIEPGLATRLHDRLVRADLVPPGSELSQMSQALEDLAQRLLHVLGEYDSPAG